MKKIGIKSLTSSPPQVEVVTLAVFLLGGDQRAIDTEDVAVEAHRLAPGRFAWRKYPEQVNLELVRVYLSDAKKPSKGAWLEGSGNEGWSLTPAGLTWAKDAAGKIRGRDLHRERQDLKSGSVDERRWRRERARITSSDAWVHWAQGASEISPRDAADVFRIDSYADQRLRNLKVGRIRAMFEDDSELAPFLTKMAGVVERQKEK